MIGTVRAIAKGGAGVVISPEGPVFVPGVLPGETIEFSIRARSKGVGRAVLQRVLEASPFRVGPVCRHYPECGGCNFQHIAYVQQLEYKKTILRENLERIGRLREFPEIDVVASPPFRYRTRLEVQLASDAVGFFQRRSRRVLAIDECWQAPQPVQEFIRELGGRPIGRAGQVHILSDGESVSALHRTAHRKHYLTPRREISFMLRGNSYSATPKNFLQANRFLLAEMIDQVERALAGCKFASIGELFSGIGFFTLPLASRAQEIFAMENDPGNLQLLRRNADNGGIGFRLRIISGDVHRVPLPPADVYLADPPRAGLGQALIARITAAAREMVLLFSCDSATFSRDLASFAASGFLPQSLTLFDNFPQTDHFEIFAVLSRK